MIPGDPEFRILPIDGTHCIDFQYMIMYETDNPKNWQKVYRSKFNSRFKPNLGEVIFPAVKTIEHKKPKKQ